MGTETAHQPHRTMYDIPGVPKDRLREWYDQPLAQTWKTFSINQSNYKRDLPMNAQFFVALGRIGSEYLTRIKADSFNETLIMNLRLCILWVHYLNKSPGSLAIENLNEFIALTRAKLTHMKKEEFTDILNSLTLFVDAASELLLIASKECNEAFPQRTRQNIMLLGVDYFRKIASVFAAEESDDIAVLNRAKNQVWKLLNATFWFKGGAIATDSDRAEAATFADAISEMLQVLEMKHILRISNEIQKCNSDGKSDINSGMETEEGLVRLFGIFTVCSLREYENIEREAEVERKLNKKKKKKKPTQDANAPLTAMSSTQWCVHLARSIHECCALMDYIASSGYDRARRLRTRNGLLRILSRTGNGAVPYHKSIVPQQAKLKALAESVSASLNNKLEAISQEGVLDGYNSTEEVLLAASLEIEAVGLLLSMDHQLVSYTASPSTTFKEDKSAEWQAAQRERRLNDFAILFGEAPSSYAESPGTLQKAYFQYIFTQENLLAALISVHVQLRDVGSLVSDLSRFAQRQSMQHILSLPKTQSFLYNMMRLPSNQMQSLWEVFDLYSLDALSFRHSLVRVFVANVISATRHDPPWTPIQAVSKCLDVLILELVERVRSRKAEKDAQRGSTDSGADLQPSVLSSLTCILRLVTWGLGLDTETSITDFSWYSALRELLIDRPALESIMSGPDAIKGFTLLLSFAALDANVAGRVYSSVPAPEDVVISNSLRSRIVEVVTAHCSGPDLPTEEMDLVAVPGTAGHRKRKSSSHSKSTASSGLRAIIVPLLQSFTIWADMGALCPPEALGAAIFSELQLSSTTTSSSSTVTRNAALTKEQRLTRRVVMMELAVISTHDSFFLEQAVSMPAVTTIEAVFGRLQGKLTVIALRESQLRLQLLFARVPCMLWFADPEGRSRLVGTFLSSLADLFTMYCAQIEGITGDSSVVAADHIASGLEELKKLTLEVLEALCVVCLLLHRAAPQGMMPAAAQSSLSTTPLKVLVKCSILPCCSGPYLTQIINVALSAVRDQSSILGLIEIAATAALQRGPGAEKICTTAAKSLLRGACTAMTRLPPCLDNAQITRVAENLALLVQSPAISEDQAIIAAEYEAKVKAAADLRAEAEAKKAAEDAKQSEKALAFERDMARLSEQLAKGTKLFDTDAEELKKDLAEAQAKVAELEKNCKWKVHEDWLAEPEPENPYLQFVKPTDYTLAAEIFNFLARLPSQPNGDDSSEFLDNFCMPRIGQQPMSAYGWFQLCGTLLHIHNARGLIPDPQFQTGLIEDIQWGLSLFRGNAKKNDCVNLVITGMLYDSDEDVATKFIYETEKTIRQRGMHIVEAQSAHSLLEVILMQELDDPERFEGRCTTPKKLLETAGYWLQDVCSRTTSLEDCFLTVTESAVHSLHFGLAILRFSRGGGGSSNSRQHKSVRNYEGSDNFWTMICMDVIASFASRIIAMGRDPMPGPEWAEVGKSMMLVLEQLIITKQHCSLVKTAIATFNGGLIRMMYWAITVQESLARRTAGDFLDAIKRVYNAAASSPEMINNCHLMAITTLDLLASSSYTEQHITETFSQCVIVLLNKCNKAQRESIHDNLSLNPRALFNDLLKGLKSHTV